MRLNQQQFEETKTRILMMDSKQKQELARILNLDRKTEPREYQTPGALLHRNVQQALQPRILTNIPALHVLKKVQPKLAARFESVAAAFAQDLSKTFPKATFQETYGLHQYFTRMAVNRVEDMDLVLSAENVLDALVPLYELVDDQLPGYRVAGILQTMVLRKLGGGGPQCSGKTQ